MVTTNRPPQAGAAVRSVPDARRRRTILAAVCIALMAVIASVSGLTIAL